VAVNRDDDRSADSETQLVRAVKAGNADAFDRLVREYLDGAHAMALGILRHRQDAEDAVQEAFIRALERIDQLAEGSPFGPWFYTVLRSTCLNLLRREKLRDHEDIPHGASGGSDPERETARRMTRKRVLEALETLPDRQRTTVMLYDLEGYSHREIAEMLDISPGTSRAHLHHARKALREELEHEELERIGARTR